MAGAWNALGGMERTHPKAIHHRDVLEIYCEILRGQIDRLSQSFERKLGAGHNSFQIIYAAVTDEMSRAAASEQAQGMPPPKKEKKVTRAAVGHAVKVAICSHRASLPPPSPSREAVSTMEPMECMHPLLCLEELIHAEVMEAKISLITDVSKHFKNHRFCLRLIRHVLGCPCSVRFS